MGNILGSNVFNLLGILGSTALVAPQSVNTQILWLDAPLMLALTVLLVPVLRSGSRMSRAEGATFLCAYAVYLWALFVWAPDAFPAAAA